MKRRLQSLRALAVLTLCAGCSLLGPDDPYLQGSWGMNTVGAQLTASKTKVTLAYLPCTIVEFTGPATLIHGDSFFVVGHVAASSSDANLGQEWRVAGTIRGDTIVLNEQTQGFPDHPWYYETQRVIAGLTTPKYDVCGF